MATKYVFNPFTGRLDTIYIPDTSTTQILTTAGVVDDSNTVFPFSEKPSIIVQNGQSWRDGSTVGGVLTWTWNAGTLEATMWSPVGTGGDIYGVVIPNNILTTASTVDDTNVSFVFTEKPTIIVQNGQSWREGSTVGGVIAWTWNAGTLTATMWSPVGIGGDIYGVV